MNPWLERVYRSTAASIASPLSTSRRTPGHYQRSPACVPPHPSVSSRVCSDSDFAFCRPSYSGLDSVVQRPRESLLRMQAAQRLVLQVCDAQEREDVKRNMLSELVPLMLELIEAPDFEPERCVQNFRRSQSTAMLSRDLRFALTRFISFGSLLARTVSAYHCLRNFFNLQCYESRKKSCPPSRSIASTG